MDQDNNLGRAAHLQNENKSSRCAWPLAWQSWKVAADCCNQSLLVPPLRLFAIASPHSKRAAASVGARFRSKSSINEGRASIMNFSGVARISSSVIAARELSAPISPRACGGEGSKHGVCRPLLALAADAQRSCKARRPCSDRRQMFALFSLRPEERSEAVEVLGRKSDHDQ